ncbi:hypothetical protein DPEC_G00234280 [Dallia pectoralis]|uniref:Uncharacterized protein n=1 Tax=Dallia pectoralis TaxID=75939 RepID=A0ACC2FY56_DALPE|nr:hypothetical protein DPEC_G00234280 [Dallia pectoralis]
MSLSETKDEVRTSSKRSRFGEGNETKNKSVYNQKRQTSPVPSCVSVKSDRSMRQPIQFKGDISTEQSQFDQKRPTSPVPSCVSMKSDRSMRQPIQFKDGDISTEQSINYQKRETSPVPSCVSMKSDQSMGHLYCSKGDISTEQRCTAKEEPLKIIQHGSKNDTQEKDEFVMICQQDLKSNLKKRLDGCNLTYKSCESLAISLQTPNCPLRELDLSYNPLQDKGVELLCSGPSSPLFNIQTLVRLGNQTAICWTGGSTLETGETQYGSWWRGEDEIRTEEICV